MRGVQTCPYRRVVTILFELFLMCLQDFQSWPIRYFLRHSVRLFHVPNKVLLLSNLSLSCHNLGPLCLLLLTVCTEEKLFPFFVQLQWWIILSYVLNGLF